MKQMFNSNPIPVVYFHSIAPSQNPNWIKNFLTVELDYFISFLDFLTKAKIDFVDLNYYYTAKNDSSLMTKNKMVLSFDDGYADNWIYVFPLLKKYNIKATIFVSPECINTQSVVRKNLNDYWENKVSFNELEYTGYLSWQEIEIMERSGLVDIQSHNLTHTKYFISDEIVGYHHPNSSSIYPIWNLFPDAIPVYFTDKTFRKLIPYGFPIFREASSIIARKVEINPQFIDKSIFTYNSLKKNNIDNPRIIINKLNEAKIEFSEKANIVIKKENDTEYSSRVNKELLLAKQILEKRLNKTIEYICWPDCENSEFVHSTALKLGYKATTIGKLKKIEDYKKRIDRIGIGKFRNRKLFSQLEIILK